MEEKRTKLGFDTFDDEGSGNIYKFTPDGVRTTFASGLSALWGLALNSGGDLFAASFYGNIYEFTPGGAETTFASGLDDPTALAFGPSGSAIPEPATWGLLAGVAALVPFVCRRREA
ncbi:MAG: PEP-CTERM sorting domain-containing protein [Limisphaerales bacterium]